MTDEEIQSREDCYRRAGFADETSRDFAIDPECVPGHLEGLSELEVIFLTRLRPTFESVEAIHRLRKLKDSDPSGVKQVLVAAANLAAVMRFESEALGRSLGYNGAELIDVSCETWRSVAYLLEVGLPRPAALRLARASESVIATVRSLAPFTPSECALLARSETAAAGLNEIDQVRSLIDVGEWTPHDLAAFFASGQSVSMFLLYRRWQSYGLSEDAIRRCVAENYDPRDLSDLGKLTFSEREYLETKIQQDRPLREYIENIRILRKNVGDPELVAYILKDDCSRASIRNALECKRGGE